MSRKTQDYICIGADSETIEGEPMTFQFYSEDVPLNKIVWVNPDKAVDTFIRFCDTLPKGEHIVMWVHNLDFDLVEFFWEHDLHIAFASQGGDFNFTVGEWEVSGVYGSPSFCRMRNYRTDTLLDIRDSYLWFQSSLAVAADLVCPNLPKLARVEGLGSKKFKRTDKAFIDYAMRDSVVSYHLGKAIQSLHEEFGIGLSVSLADMAARIFKTQFLQHTIPQPSREVIMAAYLSYHGGKNNVIPDGAPRWHLGVRALDISSAYPYAMSQFPSFSNPDAYVSVTRHRRKNEPYPPFGIYYIDATIADCHWPSLFHHNFKKASGRVQGLWVHGFELNEALRTDEVKIHSVHGYAYLHERDNTRSPFKAYMDHFYNLKETATDPVRRYMYKILMNALYGKFIQTRKVIRGQESNIEQEPMEQTQVLQAGGMFHPFIASSITAHTRAYIHELEHCYQAIHTSTDGIYTRAKRLKGIGPKTGIGSIKVEAEGDLLLLRNKLYILYSDEGGIPSKHFKGKRILKYAKHGFMGSIHDLERLVASNKRKYTIQKPNKLKESLKRGLTVNKFEDREYMLKIGPIKR
jgi:hypothetical protein